MSDEDVLTRKESALMLAMFYLLIGLTVFCFTCYIAFGVKYINSEDPNAGMWFILLPGGTISFLLLSGCISKLVLYRELKAEHALRQSRAISRVGSM